MDFVFLSCLVPSVMSYPLNQTGTEPTIAFMPNPTGRGTIGLLYSCTLTLALCIWTAMHPDVGFHQETWFYGPAYKTTWMLLAIVYPEFVLCCGVSQFVQARDLCKAWETHWKKEQNEEMKRWLGISGAFLVNMGGYEITCPTTCARDTPHCPMANFGSKAIVDETISPQPFEHTTSKKSMAIEEKTLIRKPRLPSREVRRTLTSAGLKRLLEPKDGHSESLISKLINEGVLDRAVFDPRQIEDKGKANYIAKLITTVQILWMVVQWIGRMGQGLPITVLEIHILVKIPYTLVAYLCWWDKPLDLKVPIRLPIAHHLEGVEWAPSPAGPDFSTHDSNPSRHEQLVRERTICTTLFAVIWRSGYDFIWDFGHQTLAWCTIMIALHGGLHATAWLAHFPTQPERILWRLSCVGVAIVPMIIIPLIWKRECECFVIQLAYRWATRDLPSLADAVKEGVFMWNVAAGAVEGGNRVGGVGVMRPPTGFPTTWPLWCRHLAVSLVFILIWVYMLSNIFFLVEAFISIRSVEASAYRTVDWADYLPHF